MGLLDKTTSDVVSRSRKSIGPSATTRERRSAVVASVSASPDGAYDVPDDLERCILRGLTRAPDPDTDWFVLATRVAESKGLHRSTVEALAESNHVPEWMGGESLRSWAQDMMRGGLTPAQQMVKAADGDVMPSTVFRIPDVEKALEIWDGTMWVPALSVGKIRQNGQAVEVDEKFLKLVEAEFHRYQKELKSRGVHWRPPINVPGAGGPHTDSGRKDGDVIDVEYRDGTLWLRLEWLPAARRDVVEGRIEFGSINIQPAFVDPKTQTPYGPMLKEVSETNDPKERQHSFSEGVIRALKKQGLSLSIETEQNTMPQGNQNAPTNQGPSNNGGQNQDPNQPEGNANQTGVTAQLDPAVQEAIGAMLNEALAPIVETLQELTKAVMDGEGKKAGDGQGDGSGNQPQNGGGQGGGQNGGQPQNPNGQVAASVDTVALGNQIGNQIRASLAPVMNQLGIASRANGQNISASSTPGAPGQSSGKVASVNDALAMAREELGPDADRRDVVRRSKEIRGEN